MCSDRWASFLPGRNTHHGGLWAVPAQEYLRDNLGSAPDHHDTANVANKASYTNFLVSRCVCKLCSHYSL